MPLKPLHLLAAASALVPLSAIAAAPANAREMTPQDLVTMKRLGSPATSPDGSMVVYTLRSTDLEANRGRTDLYMQAIAKDAKPQMVASTPQANESDAVFAPDGKSLWYLSDASGKSELYRYDLKARTSAKVSDLKADIAGFKLSRDGSHVAVWGDIGRDCATFGCDDDGNTADDGEGSGRTYDSLFVRHWDQWETPGNYSRLFVFAVEGGKLAGDGTPMDQQSGPNEEGEMPEPLVGDTPTKPFGGGEEIAFSPSGKGVLFAARKADADEPRSTNVDIYGNAVDGSDMINLTEENLATDTLPAPSPDGKWMAWASMARPGYESDKLTVQLLDADTGEVTPLTADWDRSVGSITWAADSKSLLVTAGDTLDTPLFRIGLDGMVTRLTEAGHVSSVNPLPDGRILIGMDSINAPTDLYLWAPKKPLTQITSVNAALLAEIDPVTIDKLIFRGAEGDAVYGQIIKPTGSARGSRDKLPVAFLVHGGPQGSFGNSWSFRWNPKVMASQGYGVVTVDFHGSTGYGQDFTDSINQDWGGKPLEDLQKGLAAALKAAPEFDGTRVCALGASYGGYMMNWIEGNWPDRFKCIVNHDGMFDTRAFYHSTEELWFPEHDFGGSYEEAKELYEKWNPVNYTENWKTPMLIIHGEKDFRISLEQSLAPFTVLQNKGIPSELLVFPDENHWVLKPKNSLQWHRTVFDWLDRFIGDPPNIMDEAAPGSE